MTVNLFPLYVTNFMFHTMLDAVGNILRLHYKSMKLVFHFHKVALGRYLGEVNMFFMCKNVLSACSSAKTIFKNQTRFFVVMITNVLPCFYGPQCI